MTTTSYTGFVQTISERGVFIAAHTVKVVDDILELSIRSPSADETVRATGEARWVLESHPVSVFGSSNPNPGVRKRKSLNNFWPNAN
ncbi:MAG TPA: hypothetical protein VIV60_35370 [Polyangiaceae bacterium]